MLKILLVGVVLTTVCVPGRCAVTQRTDKYIEGKTHCIAEDLLQVLVGFKSCSGKDTSRRPAFFASLVKYPYTFSGINSILIFEDVKINRGNGYDKKTGIFEAPRRGLYHFSSLIVGYSGHAVTYQINKNDAVYTKGYSTKGVFTSSTLSVYMELERGDRVYIKHRTAGAELVAGSHHSTFGGHFLNE